MCPIVPPKTESSRRSLVKIYRVRESEITKGEGLVACSSSWWSGGGGVGRMGQEWQASRRVAPRHCQHNTILEQRKQGRDTDELE